MKLLITSKGIIYLLCVSIIMFAFSLIFNYINFFVWGEIITGLVGLLIFVGMFVDLQAQFHFLKILAAATLIGTGMGTFNTYTSVSENLGTDWSIYTGTAGTSVSYVTVAQIVVNLYCLFLFLFGNLSTSKYSHATKKNLRQIINLTSNQNACFTLLKASFVVSILQLFVLSTGLYTFQGLTNEEGVINPFAALVVSAAPTAVFSLGLLSSKLNLSQTKVNKYLLFLIYGISLITQLIWFLGGGRRELVYAAVVFLLGLRFSYVGSRFILNRKNLRSLLMVILVAPILYIGWKAFIFIRVLSYREPLLFSANLFEIIKFALIQYLSDDSKFLEVVQQHESKNLSTRTFVLNYLAQLIENTTYKPPLLGQDLWSSFLNSIPRFVFNNKSSLLLNENLYNERYGLPITDNADSLYFSAYGDFSWLGTFIYPLILFLVFNLALRFLLFSKLPLFVNFGFAALTRLSLTGGEGNVTSWIVTFREILIFFIIFKLLHYFLFRTKLNHSKFRPL